MSATCSEVRRGAYFDSVVLMQLQRSLAQLPGVHDAGVVMATAANRDLLAASDLLTEEAGDAGPDDLLIVVRAGDEEHARSALGQIDTLLTQRRSQTGQQYRPRSLPSAAKALSQAEWALVSVPGRYAAGVAREALDNDLHVFLYSDNVSVEDEISLKTLAAGKGLLLMGPDCGTAIVNGIGLGFANRTRKGAVGLVAASGTGLQAVTSHIQRLGGGISQAIGTGGRDLSREVGGATTLQALDLLGRDVQTAVIVLISKPPAAEVAARVLQTARKLNKPVVVYFMGHPVTVRSSANLHFALNLVDAAELAVSLATGDYDPSTAASQFSGLDRGYLRGLFSGGTLAYELMLALQNFLSPLYSNVPLHAEQRLADPLHSKGHTILDLGADEFTQGRLHPMMDNTLRVRRLQQEASEPGVGMIVLDVVLGEGSHPDPASELAPPVAQAIAEHGVDVAVLLVGTADDPQDLARQREQFEQVGARVFEDTVTLAEAITQSVTSAAEAGVRTPVLAQILQRPLAAINVGLESFYDSLVEQGAKAIHVAWRPPAGGNEKMMALLSKLKSS